MKKTCSILLILINLLIGCNSIKNQEPTYIDEQELKIDQILNNMTLEEKIGQMFIINLEELEKGFIEHNNPPKTITEKQIENLQKYNVGGVIYFSNNLSTKEDLITYNQDLQNNSKYPLFIAIDEEGGRVSRLGKKENMGVTKFPSMQSIGDTNDINMSFNVGKTLGEELKALGFNVNFAPVADINTNPNNLVIGDRAFGDDPNKVATMVEAYVEAMQLQNISATLKHFPGHGDTSTDTHFGSAVIMSDLDSLKEKELIPFKKGIDAKVDFILTAHITLPEITSDNFPATMSEKIITDLLRNDLAFDGIIITDALDMKAITDFYSSEEIAKNCVTAGNDILLMPQNFFETYNALMELVKNGQISEDRINESVRRILKIKIKRTLF